MTDDRLDKALIAAHEAGALDTLVVLYTKAAAGAKTQDQEAFYLTQAHVFAMEIDHPEAQTLRDRLITLGRETPL